MQMQMPTPMSHLQQPLSPSWSQLTTIRTFASKRVRLVVVTIVIIVTVTMFLVALM